MIRLAALLALVSGPIFAQGQCAPREVVVNNLREHYGEERQSIGLSSGDRLVETFASAETGTWTITVTFPDGIMCVIVIGEGWMATRAALPGVPM